MIGKFYSTLTLNLRVEFYASYDKDLKTRYLKWLISVLVTIPAARIYFQHIVKNDENYK